jgi:sigma-54 dependent transcriptional regulator
MTEKELQSIKHRYGIVGNSEALNRAIETALKVARVDLSVLIQGENGVGKEIIPRIIHDASPRKNKRYLALNCGAIPEGTIDSELFGHVKGAFTGSVDSREGYFSAADGGTLFLDEVGELPLQTQVRLLRVLETGEFIPVGSSEVKKTNVRIVAATNVDMKQAIADREFRQDLYYRLAAVSIAIPPLRERGNDIDILFRKFALEMSERYQMPPIRLNDAARSALLSYSWPGNIRQLKNVAETMSVTEDVREITPEILAHYINFQSEHTQITVTGTHTALEQSDVNARLGKDTNAILQMILTLRHDIEQLKTEVAQLKQGQWNANNPPSTTPSYLAYHRDTPVITHEIIDNAEEIVEEETQSSTPTAPLRTKNDVERDLIIQALRKYNGHRKQAADQIGISERTLYRKIKEYGLEDL